MRNCIGSEKSELKKQVSYSHVSTYYSSADCKGGTECSYVIKGLDPDTPYSVLVVAANSATDDPNCIDDVTILGSRYLVFIVGADEVTGQQFSLAVMAFAVIV